MKTRLWKGRRGKWLLALGAGLMLYALIGLWRAPNVAQYIAPAPQEIAPEEGADAQESGLARLAKDWEARRGELGEGAKAGMAAVKRDVTVSCDASGAQAGLVAAGDGWFEAHPLLLTEGSLPREGRVAVLDRDLAFALFPTVEAVGQWVEVDGVRYEVAGVARNDRGVGDTDDKRIYIPLSEAAKSGMQTEYVRIDCREPSAGAKRALEGVAADLLDGGNFYDSAKETMRATMILRVLAILFALYLLFAVLRRWNRRTASLVRGWQAEVLKRYFKSMLPKVIGLSLLQLAGYAALIAAAWCVLRLTIRPMYVFTEWIPEVVVEWNQIARRAQELTRTAAATARYQTPEYAAIRFYAGFVRWGAVSALAGAVLYRGRKDVTKD